MKHSNIYVSTKTATAIISKQTSDQFFQAATPPLTLPAKQVPNHFPNTAALTEKYMTT